ncbi:hypothetical protein K504DRAFT_383805 [Pleomassaria siparia CBS 279.74]|uniref:protein disulfide-isomerase n=1 Tax=Pleomassaria siparia CBS 279.74 TaxID=1314801 RepID=A0A6G1K2X2_9PLEO|nr:hypothetical protein K504DRAFT_383805 [Pleomassaria siparia CBS 279.74]
MHITTLVCLLSPFFLHSSARLVEDASKSGFASLLKENELLFATFTSRTTESLYPFHDVFEQAADDVKTPFVMINCEDEWDLCQEYDVNTYPALKLFKRRRNEDDDEIETKHETDHGMEVMRYRGRRTKNAMRSFVKKHELPVMTQVVPSTLADMKKIDDMVVIAYLRPDQKALLDIFQSFAQRHYHDFVFGYSTDMATADAEGLAMPAVVCYKNTDGDDKVMNGHFQEIDLDAFLSAVSTKDVIGEFNERTMDAFMAPGKLAAYLFASTEDDQFAIRRELTPIAKRYAKFVTFGIADAFEYGPMAANFGLKGDKFPALAIHAPMNDNVFVYRQGRKIQAATVEAMLTTILQAKATSGQIFGDDAPKMREPGEDGHDEL